jgi:hypothetical protein
LTLAKTFININGTLILTNLKKGGETPYGKHPEIDEDTVITISTTKGYLKVS